MDNKKGIILRIEKGSTVDGDGTRTVIFLKGCPLRCSWCSTPESQSFAPEVGYMRSKCTGCMKCVAECPHGALSADKTNNIMRDKGKCNTCFHCVEACPRSAHIRFGEERTAEEIVSVIEQDSVMYFLSGGGVTFSGGECLGQADFVAEVLKECHFRGINTTIETSLAYPYSEVEKVLPHLDVLYADMKCNDSELHQRHVGCDLKTVLDNLERINASEYPVRMRIRIPTIPTVNDTRINMQKAVDFCLGKDKIESIELLPYHRLGSDTYEELGRSYEMDEIMPPADEAMEDLAKYMSSLGSGIPILTGGVEY